MNNNDILRRLRFAFDFSNKQSAELFALDPGSSVKMTQALFLQRIAKDDDDDFDPKEIASDFRISKNDILKKLRIAMEFKEDQMLSTLESGGTTLSKSELGALFRKPGHKHYRACGGQVLRAFIKGLTTQLRKE